MFIDYTAQFAKRARCVYADLFCSQYIECVVSPIFCRQQQTRKKERLFEAPSSYQKGEKTDDYCHKFCLLYSSYTNVPISVDETARVLSSLARNSLTKKNGN